MAKKNIVSVQTEIEYMARLMQQARGGSEETALGRLKELKAGLDENKPFWEDKGPAHQGHIRSLFIINQKLKEQQWQLAIVTIGEMLEAMQNPFCDAPVILDRNTLGMLYSFLANVGL